VIYRKIKALAPFLQKIYKIKALAPYLKINNYISLIKVGTKTRDKSLPRKSQPLRTLGFKVEGYRCCRVARCYIYKPRIPILVYLEGPGMDNLCAF
jgi:hypothetical protein